LSFYSKFESDLTAAGFGSQSEAILLIKDKGFSLDFMYALNQML
jgi:hypothetical protein